MWKLEPTTVDASSCANSTTLLINRRTRDGGSSDQDRLVRSFSTRIVSVTYVSSKCIRRPGSPKDSPRCLLPHRRVVANVVGEQFQPSLQPIVVQQPRLPVQEALEFRQDGDLTR